MKITETIWFRDMEKHLRRAGAPLTLSTCLEICWPGSTTIELDKPRDRPPR